MQYLETNKIVERLPLDVYISLEVFGFVTDEESQIMLYVSF